VPNGAAEHNEPDLELLIRQCFRRQIREATYDFVFARNGAVDRARGVR